jgi:RNA polymerase sigma factor (sigma-70 family)
MPAYDRWLGLARTQEVPMTRRRKAPRPARKVIRLMVVEPRTIFGVGVMDVLESEDDIEVVAQMRSAAEAIPVVGDTAPDVILVRLPSELHAAAEIARQLRRETPNAALILMGGEDDDASIVEALEVGATAHVAEIAEPAELVATIRRVADGDDPLRDEILERPDLVEQIVDAVRQSMVVEELPVSPLSPRELEILQLVARGETNREIAEELGISDQTVKNHLTGVLHKLGVPNRTRAVTYALRQGWLALDGAPVT